MGCWLPVIHTCTHSLKNSLLSFALLRFTIPCRSKSQKGHGLLCYPSSHLKFRIQFFKFKKIKKIYFQIFYLQPTFVCRVLVFFWGKLFMSLSTYIVVVLIYQCLCCASNLPFLPSGFHPVCVIRIVISSITF